MLSAHNGFSNEKGAGSRNLLGAFRSGNPVERITCPNLFQLAKECDPAAPVSE